MDVVFFINISKSKKNDVYIVKSWYFCSAKWELNPENAAYLIMGKRRFFF